MVRKLSPLVPSVALAGGVAGAVNGGHALWLIRPEHTLHWHVIPAGFAHGALLAGLAACAALLARDRPLWQRLVGIPVAGWLVGLVAWVPLGASTGLRFVPSLEVELLWWPLWELGLVASIAYAGWVSRGGLGSPRLGLHLAIGVAAGVLGSAPWWIAWEERDAWRFFPLHGVTWGLLVGAAAWRAAGRRGATGRVPAPGPSPAGGAHPSSASSAGPVRSGPTSP